MYSFSVLFLWVCNFDKKFNLFYFKKSSIEISLHLNGLKDIHDL